MTGLGNRVGAVGERPGRHSDHREGLRLRLVDQEGWNSAGVVRFISFGRERATLRLRIS